MTDPAYAQALIEAERPVGVRALTATLDALGPRAWDTPEMQRLLRAWLNYGALDRSALIGRLEALDRAGAFPAAWALSIRVSGLKEAKPLLRQVFYSLLRATVGVRDQARQTHWLMQAWQTLSPQERDRLAPRWVAEAIVQNRPEWMPLVQAAYPEVLHTVRPPSLGQDTSWWRQSFSEEHWLRAQDWGMDPARRNEEGVPFWTSLLITLPGQSWPVLLPAAEAWARQHDPAGVKDWERDAYIAKLDHCMPEQVWAHLTSRSDWLSVVDRQGRPALAHALANDMHLTVPWNTRLAPWQAQLPHLRDAQGRNLIHALLTNDHRSNTNHLRVDAFRGLVQVGVMPEMLPSGQGLLAAWPDLPDFTAMRDLQASLARFPQALWGGSPELLAEVAHRISASPFHAGWKEFLADLPETASPWWRGLAAMYAAASFQEDKVTKGLATGALVPDLSTVPEKSVGHTVLQGPFGDRFRAHLRHQALQARPVPPAYDRSRRRI